ncbi:hypothetical protein DFH06DRAFT_1224401 [Mycena polygramma]|nr:hypothetical protein DFH06DRAFT_1224401 [Mycena polygramma]
MPASLTEGQAVRNAVFEVLNSPAFVPPALPIVNQTQWPSCFDDSASEDGVSRSAEDRLFYNQVGLAILHQAIFLLVVGELAGKPAGYFLAIRNAVHCREVMEELMRKIDPQLFENITTSSLVDAGFYEFIGVLWEMEGCNADVVASLLGPVLLPLLRAAGAAFLSFEAKKLAAGAPKAANKGKGKKVEKPVDLQFILNVRKAQMTAIRSSALPQTPRQPSQSGNTVRSNIFYGPCNFNVGLHPSAFDLDSEAAIRGEVLTEDLHDLEGHEGDLAAAGARLDHSPRAQLQATQLLERLLIDSAKAGEASPRSVSLALEGLMRTIINLSPDAVPQPERRSRAEIRMPHISPHAPVHPTRSSSLPPSPRTPEHGHLLEPGFEYDFGKARTTPKDSGSGASRVAAFGSSRRPPLTPTNGRHAGNGQP